MAVADSDLLLVQRGTTPFRETAANVKTYVTNDISSGTVLPPIASAAQLGVIRVGANLAIDAGTGVLSAVIPAGLVFQGAWTDATTVPAGAQNGWFWVWEGADATLTNADWGTANGQVVSEGDRLYFNGTDWTIITGGGGGITSITGTAPIQIGGTAEIPDIAVDLAVANGTAGTISGADKAKLDGIETGAQVNVDPTQAYTPAANQGTLTLTPGGDTTILPIATTAAAGLMSSTDKTTLENLVANPGGVVSITAGDGILLTGTAGAPIVGVAFGGATPNGTPTTVMPYDISMLGDLP